MYLNHIYEKKERESTIIDYVTGLWICNAFLKFDVSHTT